MHRIHTLIVIATASLAVAGCSKDDKAGGGGGGGGGACAPLEVTVDGAEITGLGHGLAYDYKGADGVSHTVSLFNHGDATCEQILSKAGRPVPPGEVSVRATAAAGMFRGVGIDAAANLGGEVKLLGKAPSKPGDPVALCVAKTTWTPNAGAYKDKTVTIAGRFEGRFCGTLE